MITLDEKKFLGGMAAILAYFGVSVLLILQSWIGGSSDGEAYALMFWICLAGAAIPSVMLFIRIRRPDAWARSIEAEALFRSRCGFRSERARRFAQSRWVTFFAVI